MNIRTGFDMPNLSKALFRVAVNIHPSYSQGKHSQRFGKSKMANK